VVMACARSLSSLRDGGRKGGREGGMSGGKDAGVIDFFKLQHHVWRIKSSNGLR